MKTRVIGKDLEVSSLGYGCMGLSHGYGPATNKEEAINTVRAAFESGYTMFDTAEIYGPFINEEIVGEALKPYRNQVAIATKFGIASMNDKTGEMVLDSSPETVRKSVEASLSRLKIDTIDLYYQHRQDPNTPIEVVAQTMKELIEEGKIKNWGLSVVDEDTIRRAHKVCPIAAVESEYSIMYRHIEKDVLPVLEELDIALVAYSPLGKGFLTGKYSKETTYPAGDLRNIMARYKPEVMEANQALLRFMQNIATEKQVTLSQVALAWLLARNPNVVPIPGSRNIERIKENAGADKIVLSLDEYAQINKLLNEIDVVQVAF
ncbi:aldo/keto reductase [Niallia circulans]|uniref:Aldo/keto reductase n=1 Tax=Niallia circulans TaxID=1397 RepID=A0A553SRG1_NIACI|nr:aldo/keto reductase [Niallia circulans]TRZ39580.1 aldo/keto reductase [Niallia circulans]